MAGAASRARGTRTQVAAVLLLLFALILRAGVPAGWMPDASGAGPLVICTGAGPAVLQAHAGHPPAAPHSTTHHEACAFAGLGAAPPPPAQLIVAAAIASPLSLQGPALSPPASQPRHRPQTARGPPVQV